MKKADLPYQTIVELASERAAQAPQKRIYTFLQDGEEQAEHLTLGEFTRRAAAIAALLQDHAKPGERVLLLYPPGLDYITGLFGCIFAGMVAVPAYPPDPTRLERTLPRLQSLVSDAQATLALTTTPVLSLADFVFQQAPELGQLSWHASDQLPASSEAGWREPALRAGDLAVLQYTSGSTRAPRGVMLSHQNLLHNSALISQAFEVQAQDVGVIWLPPYHDMGLIGGILQPLYADIYCVLMSPLSFLQRPYRWLQAISRYRATISGGPNFAYDLCARKITAEQRAALDLSCWELAFNGAEPVRLGTLTRFAKTFDSCGFSQHAFYPCYGLAEATLIVSGARRGGGYRLVHMNKAALERGRVELAAGEQAHGSVGCGTPLDGLQLAIVDPQTQQPAAPERVGEVWVSGESIAAGYWNRPIETEQVFQAQLAGKGAETPSRSTFLRTGDLGFILDGDLHLTGRIKDLIIVRGRNLYPQDIENTVENCHPALRPGCSAAFSMDVGGEERLVILQEIRREFSGDLEELVGIIRQAVAAAYEVQAYAIALIRPHSIPKTSSGKIMRHACREAYLAGGLEVIWSSVLEAGEQVGKELPEPEPLLVKALRALPPNERQALLENHIREQVARLMGIRCEQISTSQPLSTAGLDSVVGVDLLTELEAALEVKLDIKSLSADLTIADLAERAQASLGSSPEEADVLRKAPPEDEFPLSQGQRALWFVQQLVPDSVAHNIVGAVRLRSAVDIAAMQRAFRLLTERHPALRTTFSSHDGEPVQRVHARADFLFQVEQAAGWSEAELEQRLAEETYRPFDVEHGPLLRVFLFTRSQKEHILFIALHHLVTDLWSMAIILAEVPQLYAQASGGSPAKLKPLKLGYRHHVMRQAELLAGPEGERLLRFWREQLAAPLPTLNLPSDRPRPPVQTDHGSAQFLRIAPELVGRLKEVASEHRTTLFNLTLAAFQVLLQRYSGQDEIILGTPKAGRKHDMARVVGYFINPVVLRANLGGDPSFAELLAQVTQRVAAAFEHDEYPFPLLVEHLQPKRDLSRTPLFQVLFAWQKTTRLLHSDQIASFALGEERGGLDFESFRLEPVSLAQRVVPFDLTLLLAEAGDELAATIEYNSDLFDADTIQRMLAHYQTLLEGIASDPEQRISQLPLLTREELEQVLGTWAGQAQNLPPAPLVHTLFEAQAVQRSDELAIVCGEAHLTYGELNRRANQLAHYLIKAGLAVGSRVGVCLERNPQAVVALLATFKAGGAYLPLDPAYPAERISFLLADGLGTPHGPVDFLITEAALARQLPEGQFNLVCLDLAAGEIAQEDERNPVCKIGGDDLAYVIYTSGSTGQPKGVLISHGTFGVHCCNVSAHYELTERDRVLQFAAFTFDPSLEQIFPTLMTGGRLVMRDAEIWSPQALYDTIVGQGLTVINLPPGYWHQAAQAWVDEASSGRPGQLRLLIVGGDVLQPESLQLWSRTPFKEARLLNAYGPTEATITATTFEVSSCLSAALQWRRIPIGRPLPGRKVYILDRYGQPVPARVPGELYIGGAGLAVGYLGQAELSAKKFIPDPFAQLAGERLYCTGDLARFLPDGNVEFWGRVDDQVKVRGFRVELGEIESTLADHPAVANVAVVAQPDPSGDKRLVAYVALHSPEATTSAELAHFLRQRLPAYMVPAAFFVLESLPLTSSGKIDRRSLPVYQPERPELAGGYVPPRNPLEEQLCQMWSEVLGNVRVGIYDNFFDLGGHSLLATQLAARLRSAFQVELPLRELFESPTVAGLSAILTQALAGQEEPDEVEALLAELEGISDEQARLMLREDG